MLSRYIELIDVPPSIRQEEVPEPLLSDAESAEIQQLISRLECFSSLTTELQNDATTGHGAQVIFDGVVKSYPDMESRIGTKTKSLRM